METTKVPLPLLVDLALGTPEIGAVNFSIMHTLFHLIIQQANIVHTKVEFKNQDAARIKNLVSLHEESEKNKVIITEYNVTDPSKTSLKKISSIVKRDSSSIKKKKERSKTSIKEGSIVFVEDYHGGDLARMQNEIDELKAKIEEMLGVSNNQELIEAIKVSSDSNNTNPVQNMWKNLNIEKRLESVEEGMQKLASIIEELGRNLGDTSAINNDDFMNEESPREMQEITRKDSVVDTIVNLDNRLRSLEEETPINQASIQEINEKINEINEVINSIKESIDQEKSNQNSKENEKEIEKRTNEEDKISEEKIENLSEIEETKNDEISETKNVSEIEDFEEEETIPNIEKLSWEKEDNEKEEKADAEEKHMSEKEDDQEIKVTSEHGSDIIQNQTDVSSIGDHSSEQNEDVKISEKNMCPDEKFCIIQKRFEFIENELNIIKLKLGDSNFVQKTVSLTNQEDSAEIFNKLNYLQDNLENALEITKSLIMDKDEKEKYLKTLETQIEQIKLTKADKDVLDDALADKADRNLVNRKVSQTQFAAAYDDLTRHLEGALEQLKEQENVWKIALKELQNEMGNKLDRIDLNSLQDFVNKKLKLLQERLKALAKLKKEREAAGTKKKLLRNVNCISCDENVVMRRNLAHPLVGAADSLPPSKSMRSYLTFELDAIRKQQRLPGKDMNSYENFLKQKSWNNSKINATNCSNLCNRFCGGSHTITTPQQRVMRSGNFLKQWGPEALKMSEERLVKGTDGKMYRAETEQSFDNFEIRKNNQENFSKTSKKNKKMVPKKIENKNNENINYEKNEEDIKLDIIPEKDEI